MLKKKLVVMLPTEKASILGLQPKYKELVYPTKNGTQGLIFQHLYFLSDEEIKEGEWCYVENKLLIKNDYEILKVKSIKHVQGVVGYKEVSFYESTLKIGIRYCTKIIAATDESFGLPMPSKKFIEKFIKKYNDDTPITYVNVEYEIKSINQDEVDYFIKVNPKDNTITIRSIKNVYTDADLKNLGRDIFTSLNDEEFNEIKMRDEYGIEKGKAINNWINNWIEQNC